MAQLSEVEATISYVRHLDEDCARSPLNEGLTADIYFNLIIILTSFILL